ncbi:MAG TPA: hypothetical protein PLZ51_18175, partial [Aggregatilineales bacterium]|nr:hypothetical protein [Aggregatilineales bacterium]
PFLERCPKVKWLITSQVPLNLSMEWQLMVQPLTVDGEQSASVQLFAYHAGRLGRGAVMDTDNQTIIQICDHLEGHPLAIQLVCRWLQTLSPQDILARLGTFDLLEARYADIPPRQRNLWGILRQLWDLLPLDEQHLLSQLSFFEGDFSLEAILGCCDSKLVVVDSLVGRSLLIRQNERYRLHSLIRQFVYTHTPPDEAFISRYSAYYLDIVIKHAGGIKDKRYSLTQRLFDVEYANIRKAWHNAIMLGDYAHIMESLHDFFLYIHTRGRNSDFTTWLTFALERIPEHGSLWVWITFIQV